MKKEKRKESSKSVFYLFLILFFGWILTQFIVINQNKLTITENQITGLAFQIDPLGGLSNFLSSEIRLGAGGESFPFWVYLATFAMVMSVIFIGARNIAFFKEDEKRGAAIIFSIAVSLLTIFLTNIVSWIAYLAASLGFFLVIVILVLLGLDGYFAVHKTVSKGYTKLTEAATARQTAKNALLGVRNQPGQQTQQPQQQGSSWYKPLTWGRGQQTQQPQNQALKVKWNQELQDAINELNNLLGNRGRNLNDNRLWRAFIQRLDHISINLPRDLPNIKLLNLNQIRTDANIHAQRCTRNPTSTQQNVHRQNASTFLRREALQCLRAIEAQL